MKNKYISPNRICPICKRELTCAIGESRISVDNIYYHHDCYVEQERPKLKNCCMCNKEINFDNRVFDFMENKYYCHSCLAKKNELIVDGDVMDDWLLGDGFF